VRLKEIGNIRAQLKFVNPKSKTLKDTSFRLKEEKVSDTSFDRLTFIFDSFDLSSYQLQMHECGVTNLQIE
jgi:hypothetical protein